jgi:hypothetical protein
MSPEPDNQLFSLNEQITLTFQNIDLDDRSDIKFIIYPEIIFDSVWEESELILSPKDVFSADQIYNIAVFENNTIISSFYFQTKSVEDLSEEEQNLYNESTSSTVSEQIKALYEQNPWLESLPIITDNYNIFYNFDNSSIRSRVFSAENMDDIEIDLIKKNINNELEKIGVPSSVDVEFILD